MDIKVVKRTKKINRFGARKYARAKSETDGRKRYDVAKVRVKGKRSYRYVCSCPDFVFRQHPCKHIKRFKQEEF